MMILNEGENIDIITPSTYELYDMLRHAMNVPLLADVLSFKHLDQSTSYTFEPHGPSSYRVRSIDWKSNRFLFPAVLMSLCAALLGSVSINIFLVRESSTYLKKIVENKMIRKQVKELKIKLSIDSDDEEGDNYDEGDEAGGDDDDDDDCDDDDDYDDDEEDNFQNFGKSDDDDEENDKEEEQKRQKRQAAKNESKAPLLESISTKAKGKTNALFNATVPSKLMSMIHLEDSDIELFFNDREKENKEKQKEKEDQDQDQDKDKDKDKDKDQKRCISCSGCCKGREKDFPSPFILPILLLEEFSSTRRNSLKDFIKSKNTWEKDQKEQWTTNGQTTLQRFNLIYNDWCDRNERRKVSVVESTLTLERLGIRISSDLQQCITGCRWKTKTEKQKEKRNIKAGRAKKQFKINYLMNAQEIEKECLDNTTPMSEYTAKYKIGELAYNHFLTNCMVVTGDDHDFLTFDDIIQRYETYFGKNLCCNYSLLALWYSSDLIYSTY